jgi:hypothetical protein
MHQVLANEMRYSYGVLVDAIDSSNSDRGLLAFALRNAARCLIGVAEGLSGLALFLLTSYSRRGEIDWAIEPASHTIWKLPPAPRLRQSLELFSATFGCGHKFDPLTDRWRSFEELVSVRDRLTHPDSADSLMIDMRTLDLVAATLEVLGSDAGEALTLAPDRV